MGYTETEYRQRLEETGRLMLELTCNNPEQVICFLELAVDIQRTVRHWPRKQDEQAHRAHELEYLGARLDCLLRAERKGALDKDYAWNATATIATLLYLLFEGMDVAGLEAGGDGGAGAAAVAGGENSAPRTRREAVREVMAHWSEVVHGDAERMLLLDDVLNMACGQRLVRLADSADRLKTMRAMLGCLSVRDKAGQHDDFFFICAGAMLNTLINVMLDTMPAATRKAVAAAAARVTGAANGAANGKEKVN